MARKEDKSHAADARPSPEGGGGVSTGVAIIGFILCFLAGGAVMWGVDSNRMKTAGICGSDVHFYEGVHPYKMYPRIHGHELAGVVEAVWDDAALFQVGP